MTRRRIATTIAAAFLATACTSTPPTPPSSAMPPPPSSTSPATGPQGSASAPESSASAAPPTAYDLIAAALAAGRIDEPTSLEYRVFALFGDSRLPSEFQGAPDPVVDSAALREARDKLADLPPAVAAAVKPYAVRPNDPASIFSRLSVGPLASPTAGGPIVVAAARAQSNLALEVAPCFNGWTTEPSLKHPFEVWARCADGATEADTYLLKDLQTIVDMVDVIWHRESTFMNIEPLPDKPGNPSINDNERIDIYLLDKEEGVIDGRELNLAPDEAALTTSSLTSFTGATRGDSGYMLLGRPRLRVDLTTFRSDVIHEFFHLLQFAWNITALDVHWFVEGSATWAESYFQPETAVDQVHYLFKKFIQQPGTSLTADGSKYRYPQTYIWPFFMQEQFGPDSISHVWQALGSVPGLEADVLNAIDKQVGGFDKVFRDFGVRNFNQDLDATDKDSPVKPLHQHWVDIGQFPTTSPSPRNVPAQYLLRPMEPTDTPVLFNDTIASLSAHYYYFEVPSDADKQVGQVIFDFTQFGPHDALDVDVLAAIKDSSNPNGVRWERRRESPTPDQLTFCRNDAKNHIQRLYLILSNHDKDQSHDPITGAFTVKALQKPCSGIEGSVNLTQTYGKLVTHLSMEFQLTFVRGVWAASGGSWTIGGSGGVGVTLSGSGPFIDPVPKTLTNETPGWGSLIGDETDGRIEFNFNLVGQATDIYDTHPGNETGTFWLVEDPSDPTSLTVPANCWDEGAVFGLTCTGSAARLPDQLP